MSESTDSGPKLEITTISAAESMLIRRRGLWNADDVQRYRIELPQALERIVNWPRYNILIEFSSASVIPQGVVDGMSEVASLIHRSGARKIAFASASTIARLQAQRVVGSNPQMSFFVREADA